MTSPISSVTSCDGLNINEVIRLAADAGKIIMESGGETYRAQDIFTRIAKACGMTEAAGFVIPTGIIATVTAPNGQTASITRLLPNRSVHLEKIARVHAIADALECRRITPLDAQHELSSIQSLKPWPSTFTIISAGIVAAFFMLIFGGQWMDFPVAFAIGAFLRFGLEYMGRLTIPNFFTHALGGLLASLLAFLAVNFGIAAHADRIIMGAIMLLVPGISIVNAIRDTLTGDLVAGTSRAVEAFTLAVAIALGTGLGLKLWASIH